MNERVDKVQIIRGSAQQVREWRPPEMGERAAPSSAAAGGALPTAAQLEELQRQARDEGFEQGRREGQEYGRREGLEEGRVALLEQLNRFEALMEALDRPFAQLDDQVERDIVTLVISMVRQLVRREIKMDPGQVVGVVREALAVLPVASRNIRVLLHPEDAALVRGIYSMGDTEQKWEIVEDPVVQRGGCKVLTETSRVDATLESRLNTLIAPLLAGERTDDTEQEPTR
ncbi:MAG: flagellar assembly protein FliH [Pseudomonadota bacterium]